MIAYINGLVIDKDEKSLIVMAQSVGYRVFSTTKLLSTAQVDQKIQVYIHTSVREDDISLYGFSNREEKKFFEQLIGVSGIGPKMAMEILSAPLHMTKQAIFNADVSILTKIKGLGKKTAERLILELKNKIDHIEISEGAAGTSSYDMDAVEALVSLGYEKFDVIQRLSKMPKEIQGTESVIKHFLKQA